MFNKILVANRGEIAVRIIRACKEMGITTVAVFSEADSSAMHVNLADESYCIGPTLLKHSYLNKNAVISVALASGCEAIHPGYGLLSENAEFAALCNEYGLVFIGPSAQTISDMGDKAQARIAMKKAGVPTVPGSEDIVSSLEQAWEIAEAIGYPVIIKATAGGGGKGIRVVEEAEGLKSAYSNSMSEALASFGNGGVYIEKYLKPVRHIEVQFIRDIKGNTYCLGERECSVQRRNQKLIEESPSAAIDETTRQKMYEAAKKAANTANYLGVGTIEFLYCADTSFYFMEMNTRLQVEHPVTEMVTGIDLVKWQIRVASGMELDFGKEKIIPEGHAIECRINAEDPFNSYRPSSGRVEMLHFPGGPWVRFDTALYVGYTVPVFYDSMIGKLIVHAKTRDEAIRKMRAALCELVIEGVSTNIDLHLEILSDSDFITGNYDTDLINKKGFC